MIYCGDSLTVLKTLPSESVNMCVTSPPYYALRDYGVEGQIGLEDSPEAYIERLTAVFREVKRVLKDDGTLWVNIGDSYWGSGSRGYDFTDKFTEASAVQAGSKGTINLSNVPSLVGTVGTYKNKDLIGIPWMLAFALRADGWYLRQDIIWQKPNPMPESVTDRCTKSHEYIFLLSKSPKYYFDHEAIQEKAKMESVARYNYEFNTGAKEVAGGGRPNGAANTKGMKNLQYKGQTNHTMHERRALGFPDEIYPVRNKRDVWSVTVNSFSGAHFATFPEKLIEPCILAGTSKGGVVLDCFNGSGTTGVVCAKNEREYIGIELNPEYVEMSNKRIGAVVEDIEARKAQYTLW